MASVSHQSAPISHLANLNMMDNLGEKLQDENCLMCGVSTTVNPSTVLLCDGPGCKHECHLYCLDTPMTQVPDGDWICPVCTSDMIDEGDEKMKKKETSFQLYLKEHQSDLKKANLSRRVTMSSGFTVIRSSLFLWTSITLASWTQASSLILSTVPLRT